MNEPRFFVRDIPVYGDVILAPMAGYSDVPHRALCRSFGSCMQYTEFVAAEDILGGSRKPARLMDFKPDEHPRVAQIFSHSADRLFNAAVSVLERFSPDILDINMGCSTRRVSGRGAGVGMMKTPLLVAEVFERLAKELPIPITGKIRLGWEENENYVEIGRIMQESGASLVAIHPRTKEQKYNGEARWAAIAELKQALSIPVIGNGDITTPADINTMLAYTGCDAVMIGRGAIGNPWIFARRSRAELTTAQLFDAIRFHFHEMIAYHDTTHGLSMFRKFVKKYLESYPLSREQVRELMTAADVPMFLMRLAQVEHELESAEKIGASKLAQLPSTG